MFSSKRELIDMIVRIFVLPFPHKTNICLKCDPLNTFRMTTLLVSKISQYNLMKRIYIDSNFKVSCLFSGVLEKVVIQVRVL